MKPTDSQNRGVPCELFNWDQTYQLARKLVWQVRENHFDPEIIVAISRG